MKKSAFSLIEISVVIIIIAIILAGIAQGSRVISSMKLTTAANLTKTSQVSAIKNLNLWLEPTVEGNLFNSNNSTNVDEGNNIKTWTDINPQSASKNTASQTTLANMPTFRNNMINGLPSLYFDGGDCFNITDNLFGYDYSVFAVIKTNNTTGSATDHAYSGAGVVSRDVPGAYFDSIPLAIVGGYIKTFVGTTSTSTTVPSGGTSKLVNDNIPHILFASRDMSNGTVNLYVDGANNLSQTSIDNSPLITDGNTSIGCIGSSDTGNRYTGYLAEVIAYNRVLKPEERQAVEQYLSKKWGIKI